VNTSHPGLLDTRRRRRGISVIEFVMAAALILGVLVASGVTLANVERSLAVSRARDGATLLAANIMTQAAQFKCQLEVDPASASGAWKRCVEALRGEALPTSVTTANPAGDLFFTAKFPTGCTPTREATAQQPATPGCTEYRALLTSRWLRTAGDPAQCQNPLKQPTMLRRTLELRWRPVSAVEDVVYKLTTLQAVPSSSAFDGTIRRGLLVRGTPGTVATLGRGLGSGKISRVLEACTTTGASPQATGEAWFPFLPAPDEMPATDYLLSIGASIDWSASNFPVFGAGSNVMNFSNPSECPRAAGEVWTSASVSCAVEQ
jgi:hypothetical protein